MEDRMLRTILSTPVNQSILPPGWHWSQRSALPLRQWAQLRDELNSRPRIEPGWSWPCRTGLPVLSLHLPPTQQPGQAYHICLQTMGLQGSRPQKTSYCKSPQIMFLPQAPCTPPLLESCCRLDAANSRLDVANSPGTCRHGMVAF